MWRTCWDRWLDCRPRLTLVDKTDLETVLEAERKVDGAFESALAQKGMMIPVVRVGREDEKEMSVGDLSTTQSDSKCF